jgi:hypothetical protein
MRLNPACQVGPHFTKSRLNLQCFISSSVIVFSGRLRAIRRPPTRNASWRVRAGRRVSVRVGLEEGSTEASFSRSPCPQSFAAGGGVTHHRCGESEGRMIRRDTRRSSDGRLARFRRRWIRRIDAFRIIGVQLPESLDQGDGSRRTLPGGFTNRMVPDHRRDAGLAEESADGRYTGFQREFRPCSEVKDAFSRIRRRGFGMNECPAAIENRPSQVFRDVDRWQICRAERRHEENKLQVRHPRILHVERLHGAAIIDGQF